MHAILEEHSNILKKFERSLHYYMYMSLAISAVLTIVQHKLVYSSYIPGIKIQSYLFWTLDFMHQALTVITIKILGSYLMLTISFIDFGTAQLKVLKYKISLLTLSEDYIEYAEFEKAREERVLRDNIVHCVNSFIQIKRYILFFTLN